MNRYLKYTPTFRVEKTIEQLKEDASKHLEELKNIVQTSLTEMVAMPFSAKFVDGDGKSIAFYLGKRWRDDEVCIMLKC